MHKSSIANLIVWGKLCFIDSLACFEAMGISMICFDALYVIYGI